MKGIKKNSKIRVGTLFSGIGAFEEALKCLNIPHKIEFACDNGEIDFIPLEDIKDRKEYQKLEKKGKKLTGIEKLKFESLKKEYNKKIEEIREMANSLSNNLERSQYINSLYDKFSISINHNYVKDSYLANHLIKDNNFHTDVRFFKGDEYENKIDIMVGGSPCQSFSSNGKRGGITDTRGTLFYEYARIISEVKPKCFIFENVKGMLWHDGGRTWSIVKSVFEDLDYNIYLNKDKNGIETPLLNAENYGIPQTRERIFLVGIRKDLRLKKDFSFPKAIPLEKFVNDFLEEEVSSNYYLGKKGFEFVTTHPTRAQVGSPIMNCQKANQQFNWNGDFIFEPISDKHTPEILKKAYVGEWNGVKGVCRKFTPRECLRLMGFPNSFKIVVNDNTMYRQCGNSIVVPVLENILLELINTGIFEG